MNAIVYSDGGKNDANGCYGSFMAVVDGEGYPAKTFTYKDLTTAPEAEVMTAMQALLYIQDLNNKHPNRVSWALALDAKFLFEHLTVKSKRKVAAKFAKHIAKAKQLVMENDVEVTRVSGEYMKVVLGH